jgi:hypothetical protein
VKQLHASLSDAQRKVVVLPLDDPRRQKISANWKITTATIGDFFRSDQQELITGIFRSVTSEDGFDRFSRQMNDDSGGLQEYSVAIFGDPGRGPFEFELTGRHHTIRADGDTIDRVAFGGPVVYGHGVRGNSSANLFSYQTKRANEVFSALDGKQRQRSVERRAARKCRSVAWGRAATSRDCGRPVERRPEGACGSCVAGHPAAVPARRC